MKIVDVFLFCMKFYVYFISILKTFYNENYSRKMEISVPTSKREKKWSKDFVAFLVQYVYYLHLLHVSWIRKVNA